MKKIVVALSSNSCAMRECIVGILNYANSKKNWNVQLMSVAHQVIDIPSLLSGANAAKIDGIITGVTKRPPGFDDLVRSGIPLVLNNHPSNWAPHADAPITLVQNDNIAIGRIGANYLHSKGRFRSFAFVRTAVKSYWEVFRHRGFNLGLAKWGITPLAHKIEQADFDGWIRRLPKPAALMTNCDSTAINVVETCLRIKIKIPDQVAILGVDNDELFCKAIRPQISSVQTNNAEMGRRAAAELDRLMRTGKPGKTIYIKPEKIIERDSTRTIPPAGHLIDYGLRFMRENFQNGITVNDIADHLGVSPALLRLRFRTIHGKSARDTLIETRLEKAKQLLLASDEPIGRVAQKVGFASPQRFSHCFAERLAMSPSDWRATQRPLSRAT